MAQKMNWQSKLEDIIACIVSFLHLSTLCTVPYMHLSLHACLSCYFIIMHTSLYMAVHSGITTLCRFYIFNSVVPDALFFLQLCWFLDRIKFTYSYCNMHFCILTFEEIILLCNIASVFSC